MLCKAVMGSASDGSHGDAAIGSGSTDSAEAGSRVQQAQPSGAGLFACVLALLDEMEATQANKVVELARRLRPGLTAEDIRNPHDFPELDDPDWHFEDGQLAGIQAVRFAVKQLARERGGEALGSREVT